MNAQELRYLYQDLSDHRNDLEQMLKTPHLFTEEIPAVRERIADIDRRIDKQEALDAHREECDSATYDLNGNPR